MRRRLAILGVAAALAAPIWLFAHPWLAECNIGFDNEFALRTNYDQARLTFASHTGIGPDGRYERCNPRNLACWTYRQRCGSRG